MTAPLFRDPVHDGATDPVLVQHRADGTWWLFYTQRRASVPGPGVAWVHGSDIGVAVSDDGGATFRYRGTAELSDGGGRDTYWAPEVTWAAGEYHMYVTVIRGVPDRWPGHARRIVHHVSDDLVHWRRVGPLTLSSDRVIDACVSPLPSGGWRMWFKDEAHDSHTWAADSPDLYRWDVVGPVLTHRPHEGPNVFTLAGRHWLVVDEWRGQGVYRSDDLTTWERDGLILDRPGTRPDDAGIGLHADVVVVRQPGGRDHGSPGQGSADGREEAWMVYFTHPGRAETWADAGTEPATDAGGPDPDASFAFGPMRTPAERRSSIQVARLRVDDGHLVCDRDEDVTLALPTAPAPPPGP